MAPRQDGISGVAVLALLSGAVLAYSGVKGKGVAASIRALIAGKNPSTLPTTFGIDPGAAGAAGLGSAAGLGATGGAPPAGTGPAQSQVAKFLINNLHLSPAGAAAVLGNIQNESGFNTSVLGDNGTSQGLVQWHAGRLDALRAYARSVGGQPTDLNVQLGYLRQELTGPYSGVLHQLQTTTDPAAAAAMFDQQFEGSTGTTTGKRMTDAQRFFLQMQSLLR